jgi:hypothetical protein
VTLQSVNKTPVCWTAPVPVTSQLTDTGDVGDLAKRKEESGSLRRSFDRNTANRHR